MRINRILLSAVILEAFFVNQALCNLTVHWKFDEGGTVAYDAVGTNHGIAFGDAVWPAEGVIDGSFCFDGINDYIAVADNSVLDLGTMDFSWSLWIKKNQTGTKKLMYSQRSDSANYVNFIWESDNTITLKVHIGGATKILIKTSISLTADIWYHIALSIDRDSSANSKIYINGINYTSGTPTVTTTDCSINSDINIGRWGGVGYYWDGYIDDFRVYDHALSEAEVLALYNNTSLGLTKAINPYPADNADDIGNMPILTWQAGNDANSHNVFFGLSFQDVNDANIWTPDIFKLNQTATSYLPGILEYSQTYYWRIDEVNQTEELKGDVWNFTVAEYTTIDDFETYTTVIDWIPSGAAQVGISTDPVHNGSKAMRINFDNSGSPYYSMSSYVYNEPVDWQINQNKALTLFLHGDETNSDEKLYLIVEDSNGLTAEILYSDSNDLLLPGWYDWKLWNIPLSDIISQGIDLSYVKKISICLGSIGGSTPGGTGVVYIDDIKLYPTMCLSAFLSESDLNEDCTVNFNDMAVLGLQWLSGYDIDALRLLAQNWLDCFGPDCPVQCAYTASPVLYKQIDIPSSYLTTDATYGEYGGDVRIGDLNNDSEADYLVFRTYDSGMKPCFIGAFDVNGNELWQVGSGGGQPARPGPVAIHDMDNDGETEVICFWKDPNLTAAETSMADVVIQIRNGLTGAIEKQQAPADFTSSTGSGSNWVHKRIFIANFRGTDTPRDFICKLGTKYIAFDENINVLWTYISPWSSYSWAPAYIPSVGDIDGDGKDEVNGGYMLIDDDGTVLWEEQLGQHMDSVSISEWDNGNMRAICSGYGHVVDKDGNIILSLGSGIVPHGQEVRTAKFDPYDLEPQMVIRWSGHSTNVIVVNTSGQIVKSFNLNSSPNNTGMEHVYWDGFSCPAVLYNGGMLWNPMEATSVALPGLPTPNGPSKMGWYHCIAANICGDQREEVVVYNPWDKYVWIYTPAATSEVQYEGYQAGPRQYNARLMD